jgi:hypothetical protein
MYIIEYNPKTYASAENMCIRELNPKTYVCMYREYVQYKIQSKSHTLSKRYPPKESFYHPMCPQRYNSTTCGGRKWVGNGDQYFDTSYRFCKFRYGTFTRSCRGRERSLKLKKFHNGAQV